MCRRLALPLLLLTLFSASACTRRPTYDDPARPIELRPGAEFDLTLRSNQSTGYQWVLVDSAALGPLRPAGSSYRARGTADGAGGTERWTFRTDGPGNGVISLIYVGPSENEVPKDTTRFRVRVR